MQVVMVPIEKIVPDPENPRRNASAIPQVQASIRLFGIRKPLVINHNYKIIAGHTTFAAAVAEGYKEVPCSFADKDGVPLTEAQEIGYSIMDNRTGEYAKWEPVKLEAKLAKAELLSADIGSATHGLDRAQLGFKKTPVVDPKDDDVPEAIPVCKPGDIWSLGKHRLMCGDSTNEANIRSLMNGSVVDCTVTSPPYNVGLKYNQHNDNQSDSDYVNMLRKVVMNLRTVASENYCLLWNVGITPLSLHLSLHLSLLREYFKIKRAIAWVKSGITGPPVFYHTKNNPVVKNYHPGYGWEAILCCHLNNDAIKGTRLIPQEILDDCATDVWQIAQHGSASEQSGHPGAFPVMLAERIIYLYAEHSVFDPFLGSGSTIIACEKTDRIGFGMEIDPLYCDQVIARWEKFTGQKAEKLNA